MMKIYQCWIALLLFLVVSCTSPQNQGEPIRILFIGNSYTFANQMPDTFAMMAELGGHEVIVESRAQGGYSLTDHLTDEETLSMLETQAWDYVILQEKSSIPLLPDLRENEMYPAVMQINDLVVEKNGETILFLPWAYRDGYPRSGLDTYSQAQVQIADAYFTIGDKLNLRTAPVGIAWQSSVKHDPELFLWAPDGSHPSPLGSFLAANVFYALILREYPSELEYYPPGVDEASARLVSQIAEETILDK